MILVNNTLTPIKVSDIVKHNMFITDKLGEQILWKVLEISNNSVKLSRVNTEVKADFSIWCDLSEIELIK